MTLTVVYALGIRVRRQRREEEEGEEGRVLEVLRVHARRLPPEPEGHGGHVCQGLGKKGWKRLVHLLQ